MLPPLPKHNSQHRSPPSNLAYSAISTPIYYYCSAALHLIISTSASSNQDPLPTSYHYNLLIGQAIRSNYGSLSNALHDVMSTTNHESHPMSNLLLLTDGPF